MTTTETQKAATILYRLWNADVKTQDHRGREAAIAGMTDKMMAEYKAGDYERFLGWAKEINGEFKRLREPIIEQEGWEH